MSCREADRHRLKSPKGHDCTKAKFPHQIRSSLVVARVATSQHRKEQVPHISLHSQISIESCYLVRCRMRLGVGAGNSFHGDLPVHTQDPVAIPICPRPWKRLTTWEFSPFFPEFPSLSLELHSVRLLVRHLDMEGSICFLGLLSSLRGPGPQAVLPWMWADRNKWALLLTCLFVLPFWNLSELRIYLPFLFQFQKPGQASPLSLLLLWLSSDVFVFGTNSSILSKWPGNFCQLLQFRTIRVSMITTWTVCLLIGFPEFGCHQPHTGVIPGSICFCGGKARS